MYLLDPNSGRRRRALVRDQMIHAGHEAEDFFSGMSFEDLQKKAPKP